MFEKQDMANGANHGRAAAALRLMVAVVLTAAVSGPAYAADAARLPGEVLRPIEPKAGGLIDLPMYHNPELAGPEEVVRFHARLKPLWLEALARPEADLRAQAAAAFGEAHQRGMAGLDDVAETLTTLLRDDPDRAVRLSAARTLVTLDHAPAAEAMLERNRTAVGHDMALTVDPALARWGYAPAADLWLERLEQPEVAQTLRLSAMRSLAQVKETRAVDPLRAWVKDAAASPALRLAAARALGRIAVAGLVPEAQVLAQRGPVGALLAASMLGGHSDAAAVDLLRELAQGDEPTAAATALARLNQLDPAIAAGMASSLMDHADPNVRYQIAAAVAAQQTSEAVALLNRMLSDPSVDVRQLARQTLIAYGAKPALRPDVERHVAQTLADGDWRAIEQAAFIAGALDIEAVADALLDRLTHERAEVRLAAAVALRELAVEATLPALLEHAQRLTDQARATKQNPDLSRAIGNEATQILTALGQMRHAPADALLREYVPKTQVFSAAARGAAVWALGLLHEGEPDAQLVGALQSRMSDLNPMDPEATEVRRFSAVTLGRMKAQDALDTLQRFYREENSSADIGGASRWAIMQITGETLPPLETIYRHQTGWFLEPVSQR